MKLYSRVFMLFFSLLALLGSAYLAQAQTSSLPGLSHAHGTRVPFAAPEAAHASAVCDTMEAGPVGWVTLTDQGDIDQQVDSYPGGVSAITPAFSYNCVPASTTIVTVISFEGETVFSDKETLRARNTKGVYAFPLVKKDGSALPDGEWGAAFFNNKIPLTSGTVQVGGSVQPTSNVTSTSPVSQTTNVTQTVTVKGAVVDGRTRNPLQGAIIAVLNPGLTFQDWRDRGQLDDDVFTGGMTESTGQFALEKPLTRNTTYAVFVAMKGYRIKANDNFILDNQAADPVELYIELTK